MGRLQRTKHRIIQLQNFHNHNQINNNYNQNIQNDYKNINHNVSKNIKIIVARYNEDISWTNQFNNVLIINKGNKLNLHNEIIYQNVGREAHSYFKYIYDNYHNLDDYLIFLQGNPFDHSPNCIKTIHEIKQNANIQDLHFKFISELVTHDKISGLIIYPNLSRVRETYTKLTGRILPDIILCGWGNQFMVSKKKILEKPREFYHNIIKLLDYSINPDEGFHMERLTPILFTS